MFILGKLAACPKVTPKTMKLIAVRTRIPTQPFARNPLDFLFISLLLCKSITSLGKVTVLKKECLLLKTPRNAIAKDPKALTLVIDS
jgi:hypothetical protein